MNLDKHYDAIIIGGGPAGLAAEAALSASEYLNKLKKQKKQLISN